MRKPPLPTFWFILRDNESIELIRDFGTYRKQANDIVISAIFVRWSSTYLNVFYKFLLIDGNSQESIGNEFNWKGFDCFLHEHETWQAATKSSWLDVIFRVDISDRNGERKELRFYSSHRDSSGFEEFGTYLDDLAMVGSHHAMKLVASLRQYISYLELKIKRLESKKKT